MNELISFNDKQETMSSLDFLNNIINPAREGAGERGVRPSDFNARIQDEIDEYLNYENFVVGKTGHKTYYCELTFEQMTLIGMRESKAVRRSVLETLKKLQKPKEELNLNDPKQLIGLLQNYAQRTLELEQKVEEAAPKVEFVDNYVDTAGLMTFREMCKFLKYNEREVRDWLVMNKHMYKLNGMWTFSSEWLKAKRGEHKVTFDNMRVSRISAQFTPKGFSYIVDRISK